MSQFPTITREEAKEAILAKKLTPAGLYEPEQAPKGAKFLFVDFGGGLKRFYRDRR